MSAEQLDLLFKALLVPVVIGIVEAAKQAGMNPNYTAALSILIGAIVGVILAVSVPGVPAYQAVLSGIAIGGAATGVYGVARKVGGN